LTAVLVPTAHEHLKGDHLFSGAGGMDIGAEQANFEGHGLLGYNVTVDVLLAADFGAPQMRRRLIFLGCRKDIGFSFVQRFVRYLQQNRI